MHLFSLAFVMYTLISLGFTGCGFVPDCFLQKPHKKRSHTARSWERGGHANRHIY